MIVRTAPVLAHGLRFDENLPLYGWLEDIDFARSIAPYGRVVKSMLLRGVHLGVKRGRTSGVKLGYSQIANPLYMLEKGHFVPLLCFPTNGSKCRTQLRTGSRSGALGRPPRAIEGQSHGCRGLAARQA